jgi:hypothetical protein
MIISAPVPEIESTVKTGDNLPQIPNEFNELILVPTV